VATSLATDVGFINVGGTYVPPHDNFEIFTHTLESDLLHFKGQWIIHRDFNAHSPFWKCLNKDSRGEILLDLVSKFNFILTNLPDSGPTV